MILVTLKYGKFIVNTVILFGTMDRIITLIRKEGIKMEMHVRFNGRSETFDFASVGISSTSTDREIRESLARHFDRALNVFDNLVIERHANGNITIRPEAVYG